MVESEAGRPCGDSSDMTRGHGNLDKEEGTDQKAA